MSEHASIRIKNKLLGIEQAREEATANPQTGAFMPAPDRLDGELQERLDDDRNALKYHNAILDDYLRALLPTDLVLLGAPTGLGKTDLALNIATTNAFLGKRVHYFALEAEPRELERRTKFAMLSKRVYQESHTDRHKMNYADWRIGRCEFICGKHNSDVNREFEVLRPMWTFYRGNKFDAKDLEKQVLEVQENTDLMVVDHLHYIDSDNENEQRALCDTVKTIRDLGLNAKKPTILVAHLRKRDQNNKRVIASIDDFHGSSNITKICTQAITLDRCHVVEPTKWFFAPTFISIPKDRRSGPMPFGAIVNFDRRTKSYQGHYTLGRLTKGGTDWEQIDINDKPEWAVHHKPMEEATA